MKTLLLVFFLLTGAWARASCTVQTEIRDVVGPATVDLVERAEELATRDRCESILLLINTPGGGLDSTRLLVERILASNKPFLCLVAPSGGHAGSAGAILLEACHVNGALHGTNLGAATPVALGGGAMSDDLRHKILNDTTSWMDSLTTLRGRNAQFGQDIITQAKAVSAEEALRLKAIDFVGGSQDEFLKFAQGRTVKIAQGTGTVATGPLHVLTLDLRYKVLSLFTDPELVYMMLLGSFALLYFELTHPGMFMPGIVGAAGVVIALMGLHRLDVEWAGLCLLFLGIGLLVAELFLPTFGVIGLAGLVSLFMGSLFLFDPLKTGYRLPLTLVTPVVLIFAGLMITISVLVWRTRRVRKRGGIEDLLGRAAQVTRVDLSGRSGLIEVFGETWKFTSVESLQLNDEVQITGHRGLILEVKRS